MTCAKTISCLSYVVDDQRTSIHIQMQRKKRNECISKRDNHVLEISTSQFTTALLEKSFSLADKNINIANSADLDKPAGSTLFAFLFWILTYLQFYNTEPVQF